MNKGELSFTYNEYSEYACWLQKYPVSGIREGVLEAFKTIYVRGRSRIVGTAASELVQALATVTGVDAQIVSGVNPAGAHVSLVDLGEESDIPFADLAAEEKTRIHSEGFLIRWNASDKTLLIAGGNAPGVLYGVFRFIRLMAEGQSPDTVDLLENPATSLRMINHWDNADGSIERGYAGRSIFYENDQFIQDLGRARDYARLLSSVGINAVCINNVNVRGASVRIITEKYLADVARLADVFRGYGIRLLLCVNFTSPIQIGGLKTADPLNPAVEAFWESQASIVYQYVPDLLGFLVKADSEFLPGPVTDGRTHADGANTIARAVRPFDGIVIWRCFVYNCMQDWRDTTTDRPKAAYENFMPLDGQFADNVLLQIKNGPVDFQIHEPVSSLFGAMRATREVMELQITQEYTGQQKHLCFLVPLWKEVLEFDMRNRDCPGTIQDMVRNGTIEGIAGIGNVGLDRNWTGHTLAQANLYGYARLCWDPSLTSESIADEWTRLTFGQETEVVDTVTSMLLSSRDVYEKYNAPLGIGWMVNPSYHYGPNVDGYEYAFWGTYHRADNHAIGVDRTTRPGGTGYTAQYAEEIKSMYEDVATCPEELLLFFHRLPYDYALRSGKSLLQHIYDTHFEGVVDVEGMVTAWKAIEGRLHPDVYKSVLDRLEGQVRDACEWRDVINTYFYRKTGVPDKMGRKIFT